MLKFTPNLSDQMKNNECCDYCKDFRDPDSDIRQDADFCTASFLYEKPENNTGFRYCPNCGRELVRGYE